MKKTMTKPWYDWKKKKIYELAAKEIFDAHS